MPALMNGTLILHQKIRFLALLVYPFQSNFSFSSPEPKAQGEL